MNRGLTLVEILVAVMILGVGVLAAAAMQANGLRATQTAQVMQELDAEARSAMAEARTTFRQRHDTTPNTSDCGPGCQLEARPCVLSAGVMNCTVSSTPDPVAYALLVRVTRGDNAVELSSVVERAP